MARLFIFADECGNFDFSHGPDASKYFILATVTATDCAVGRALLDLRRELAWEGLGLGTEFHASTDTQAIRDRVFATIAPFDFRIDATILEKEKAVPSLRASDEQFYKLAWDIHMRHLAPRIVASDDELLVVGASMGTRKRRSLFHAAIRDVVEQVSPTTSFRVASWDGASDPCLQVADYCAWAVQRKWERNDARSHVLIASKIASEVAPWETRTERYY